MIMPNITGRKKPTVSITIDQDLIDWVKGEVGEKRFSSLSHAVEYALHRLRKEGKE